MLVLVPLPHKTCGEAQAWIESMVGQQCKNNLEPLNVPKLVGVCL